MKHLHLKGKKDHKKLKHILISIIFILSTFVTFNYLNRNIYDYNTKEYLNLFTRLNFSLDSNIELVINKLFDFYDSLINNEVVKK